MGLLSIIFPLWITHCVSFPTTLLFQPGNLRIYNNPSIEYLQRKDANFEEVSVILYFPLNEIRTFQSESILNELQQQYHFLYKKDIEVFTSLSDLNLRLKTVEHVVTCGTSFFEYSHSLKNILKANKIACTYVSDTIPISMPSQLKSITDIQYPLFENSYKDSISACVPISIDELDSTIAQFKSKTTTQLSESLGYRIVRDYTVLTDVEFDDKYSDLYISLSTSTVEHTSALQRLATKNAFFRGEVYSGIISQLVCLGCISPQLLLGISKSTENEIDINQLFRPSKSYFIKSDVIRRDFQQLLATQVTEKQSTAIQSTTMTTSTWQHSFRYWRGFLQRESYMSFNEINSATATTIYVFLHGFGGSADQFQDIAATLNTQIVVAVDMVL
jgi:hypothetical protein